MPLESGERPSLARPWGKAPAIAGAESLRRPVRVDDRGGGPQAVLRSDEGPVPVSHSADHHQPRFADRHIGPDADAVATMLKVIGVDSLDEFAEKSLPAGILDG